MGRVLLWSTWLLPLSFSPPEGLEDTQVSPTQGSSALPSPHVLDAGLPIHLPIHPSQQTHFYLGTHLSSTPPQQPTVQGKLTLPQFQVWAWLVQWGSHLLCQGLDWACDPTWTNEIWGEVLGLLEKGFNFQGSSSSSWLSLPIAVLTVCGGRLAAAFLPPAWRGSQSTEEAIAGRLRKWMHPYFLIYNLGRQSLSFSYFPSFHEEELLKKSYGKIYTT